MVTVEKLSVSMIEIKGSKFLSHLIPMHDLESTLEQLRKNHPKAVHWVYAYRMYNDLDQLVEFSTDDGEPKGTSGKPTLSVMQGHEIVNAAIITVRYFGGTKLGPGGLVRAYADSANEVISGTEFVLYEKYLQKNYECLYSHLSMLEYELTQVAVRIIKKEFLFIFLKKFISK